MTRTARSVAALASVALALVLTGCTTPQGKPVDDYSGEPKGVEAPESSAGGASWAAWLDGGERFGIVLYGSSTCPPKVQSVKVVKNTQLEAVLAPAPGGMCTQDIVPHTTVFATPSEVDTSSDVEITMPTGAITMPALRG